MSLHISPMRPEDASDMARIAAASFPHPRDEAAFLAELSEPVARVLVAREGQRVLGFHIAWVSLDEAEIIEIAVDPAVRGRALSVLLLQAMAESLQAEGVSSLFLEVRVSNAPARRLYTRWGFEQVGRRKGYYADNGEDALLYRLALEGPLRSHGRAQASCVRGLYPILSDSHLELSQMAQVAACIAAQSRVSLMQLRIKSASDAALFATAREVAEALKGWGGTLVINDRADIARLLQEEGALHLGLHVGQGDFPVAQARTILGEQALIGLSTHHPEQVQAAQAESVDYLGYGPIFATQTKRDAEAQVGLEGLARAVSLALPLPIVAIGGLDLARSAQCLAQGASSVAVIGALFDGLKGQALEHVQAQLSERLTQFETLLRESSHSGVRA